MEKRVRRTGKGREAVTKKGKQEGREDGFNSIYVMEGKKGKEEDLERCMEGKGRKKRRSV